MLAMAVHEDGATAVIQVEDPPLGAYIPTLKES